MKLSRSLSLMALTASILGFSAAQAETMGHDYHAAVFLGATSADSKTYATAGADLEKRISDSFGVGVIVDSLVESHGQTIAAAGLFYHPTDSLKLVLAPGVEYSHGTSQSVLRVGAGYDWHLDNGLSVGPVVNADMTDGHTASVYGISTGFSF